MVMVIVARRLLAVEVAHQDIHQHLVVSILIIRNVLNQSSVFCTDIGIYRMGKDSIYIYIIGIKTEFVLNRLPEFMFQKYDRETLVFRFRFLSRREGFMDHLARRERHRQQAE